MFERIWSFENPVSGQLRRLEHELDELFESGTLTGTRDIRSLPAGGFPAMNVGSTPQAITIYLFAPGVDPKTLDISIRQHLLSIAGERAIPTTEGATYYRRQRFKGEFRRSVSLPEDADPDRVDAKYTDGVLTVTIGRRVEAKPRQIEIH
jgi:HSP20 family protein